MAPQLGVSSQNENPHLLSSCQRERRADSAHVAHPFESHRAEVTGSCDSPSPDDPIRLTAEPRAWPSFGQGLRQCPRQVQAKGSRTGGFCNSNTRELQNFSLTCIPQPLSIFGKCVSILRKKGTGSCFWNPNVSHAQFTLEVINIKCSRSQTTAS